MLTYEEWKENVIRGLEKSLGEGAAVTTGKRQKNNGQEKEGIAVHRFGYTAVPTVFLEDLYQRHIQGQTIDQCVELLMELAKNETLKFVWAVPDWEEARGSLRLVLVKKAWNESWLKEVLYQDYLDLAVVCRLVLAGTDHTRISCNVDRNLLARWGIHEEELWEAAKKNLEEEEFRVENIIGLIMDGMKQGAYEDTELTEEELDELQNGMEQTMYVASNQMKLYGAAAILRKDLLEGFASKYGRSFYILPSSLHEVLLIPDYGNQDAADLRWTVQEVNHTQVEQADWLSDQVYYFRKETGEVEIAENDSDCKK